MDGKRHHHLFVLAFLVGYREETFRELMKRATDMILQPGGQAPAPDAKFKVNGVIVPVIDCAAAALKATTNPLTVEVHNVGTAAFLMPELTVASVDPGRGTFSKLNDRVTSGGNIPPGACRTVEVTFSPIQTGTSYGTLTLTGENIAAPKTIRLSGTGTA
jgi:hypothetical protein